MLQVQTVVDGLARLAASICDKCLLNETCGGIPQCGDVQLLKQAEELLTLHSGVQGRSS